MRPSRAVRWPLGDVVLAASVAVVCQLDVWAPLSFVTREAHRLALSLVFLASSVALLWRRRAPVAVLAFVYTISSLLYLAVGAPEALGTFLPQLIAVYSVGRYGDARNLVVVVPVVLLGTALHELTDPHFKLAGPAVFYWVLLAAAWPVGHAFRQREHAVQALSERADRLQRRRDAEARAAVAAERARIARELHDVVGHGVSVVILQVVAALGLLDKGEPSVARQRLLATERSARQALAELRRLLGLLDEDVDASLAPQPGLGELEHLVAETQAAGVEVRFAVCGERLELPAGLELAVYRVAQEALTNVIKHAQPASAHLRLSYEPHDVVIEITDDGRQPVSSSNSARGIAGMRERVALYGGELTVGPRPAGGFEVRARFPIEDT
jgi:signal transduction histidine kinase